MSVCHVLNASTHDIKIPMEFLDLGEYEVWEALDRVINTFDRNMPLSLKIALLNLETTFVSHRLWTHLDHIDLLTAENANQSRLMRRILHQGAYVLHFLSKKLDLAE
jgi:hypothetical protein